MFFLFFVIIALWGIAQDGKAQDVIYSENIHISEFLPQPAEGGTAGEFIELHNTSELSQDISGWILDDIESGGSAPYSIPSGTVLESDDYMALYTVSPHVSLNDAGDHVRLIRPDGVVQDDVVYTESTRSYSYNRTDNGSYLKSPILTPNAANEFPSTPMPEPTQTPTLIPQVYSPDIHINEFLSNPKGDDAVGEFIELVNAGSESVDISEWVLDDVGDAGSAPFSIPDETVIPGNGFVSFYRTLTKISLNNDSDHVRLIRPDAVVQDDVSYTDTKEAHSYNRTDAEKYEKSSTLTPGAANIITSISTPTPKPQADEDEEKENEILYDFSDKIFINEFLPNPKGEDSELEFIEIKSFEKRNINLLGYLLDDGDGGSLAYKFTKEDIIESGKILVLFRPKTKISLNNDADQVRLIDSRGKVISEVTYDEKVVEGQSYNRNVDGVFEWSDVVTPGKENTISIQEKVMPTPKPKVTKKAPVRKVSSVSRVLSAIAPTVSMLPWPSISPDAGFISRSVVSVGNSANDLTLRQGVFVLFGMSVAGMQLINGISYKEKIWRK
ncbi:MAG: lamin tail domain-containing protein [bacterium]|nr:lamin tail domain-containing protein [bacterium]